MASLLSYAKGLREKLAPVLSTSAYLEKGVLTPEEFVEAGDQLVYKCPTWSWEAGDPSKAKSYLPLDKQYLATRAVPCHRRVATLETDYLGETELEGVAAADGEETTDGWIEPQVLLHKANETEVELGDDDEHQHHSELHSAATADSSSSTATTSDLAAALGAAQLNDDHFQTRRQSPPPGSSSSTTSAAAAAAAGSTDGTALGASSSSSAGNDDYPDLDTFVENSVAEADSATLAPLQQHGSYLTAEEPADSIVHTRSYDLSITYDKYYQVPRIWLAGRDEGGSPLPPAAIFEDIMQDYARQTVTLEAHPHMESHQASVHPCKHSAVMRRIVENLTAGGKQSSARVDQYLFVFLKFIQSVCPTIDYDYTMEIDAMS